MANEDYEVIPHAEAEMVAEPEVEAPAEEVAAEHAIPEITEEPDPTDQQPGETEEAHKKRKGGYQRKLEAKDRIIEQLTAQLGKASPVAPVVPGVPQATTTPTQPDGRPVAPNVDSFQTLGEYTKALEDYTDKLTDWKYDQRKAKEAQVAKESTFKQKWDEAKRTIPDFAEVMAEFTASVSPVMGQVIQESDVGPQIAYFLASKPEEAERIAGLSPWAAAKALGVIEAGITAKAAVKPPQKPSQAPPPIAPAKPAQGAPRTRLTELAAKVESY